MPAITWTSLASALKPDGVLDDAVGTEPVAGGAGVGLGSVTGASAPRPARRLLQRSRAGARASRSSRFGLHALTTPTLILQGRHDFSFDLDQALAAYRLLEGPRFLYLGDLGAAPAASPAAEPALYLKPRRSSSTST